MKYRSEERPHVVVKVDSSGDMWLFSVRDNGIGFDPRVFGSNLRYVRPLAWQGPSIPVPEWD
ncbi:MAG: hypothetical protein R3F51_23125 [Cyanobacteriota/Melainabacteria group bacterium]